jgi:limonene-1,2-epoxide hydrolase
MNAQAVVEEFINAWNRSDLDSVYSMMAEDIIWDNIPMGLVQGIEACKGLMANFPPMEAIEFVTHHISSKGNVVMTERTDRFLVGGKWRAIRLMGIFEVNGLGQVQHWRDYFDMAEFQREFA